VQLIAELHTYLGKTEISKHDMAILREQNVFWLEVSMNNSDDVQVVYGKNHLSNVEFHLGVPDSIRINEERNHPRT
jgi:hypothetical protein